MAIDINKERLVTLSDAARRLGKHRDTVLGWILHGCRGRKLDGLRLGDRWHTSEEALQRFVGQPVTEGGVAQPPPRALPVNKEHEEATAYLRKRGLL